MNPVVSALQAALAAEHQAVFGYEMVGPRLGADAQHVALALQTEHEATRNQVIDLVTGTGVAPQAAQAQYPGLQALVNTPRSLAAHVEDGCAAAWRYVYAVAADSSARGGGLSLQATRRLAQQQLMLSAVRAVRWRRMGSGPYVTAFPGG